MARSHARLLAAIWGDDDWTTLSAAAQRVYVLVLSQPKLSLVGAIDYLPSRWASFASDTSIADIDDAVAELEASRFVSVDRATCELAVRSFAKHDLPAKPNINQLKGVWSAWSAISSRHLRAALAAGLPEHLWEQARCHPPAEAVRMRANPQVAPVETTGRNEPSERAVQSSPLPPTVDRHPSAAAAEPSRRLSQHERQVLIDDAIDILTDRAVDAAEGIRNIERYRSATRHGKHLDHSANAHLLLSQEPGMSAEALANELEPPPKAAPRLPDYEPRVVVDALDGPDALDLIAVERALLKTSRA